MGNGVSCFVTKAVNFSLRDLTVKPLKCVFDRNVVQPLKCLF